MNDQFKNLFKGIVFILLLVVVLLCLSITFHSCRSQKQATTLPVPPQRPLRGLSG